VRILLANTYHLYLRPGAELIRGLGGLHRFMSWPHAILTDSGGFQVFSLSGLRKIDDDGVTFQSHLNGDSHRFTPESTVDAQLAFGSDILMALDECPEYPVSHEFARAEHAAHGAAGRGKRPRTTRGRVAELATRHALFPIVQGSTYRGSAARVRRGPGGSGCGRLRDWRAFGGRAAAVEPGDGGSQRSRAAAPRPRYAMGVGCRRNCPNTWRAAWI
jgi:queuine tRNA-ribosyltransferase